MKLTKVALLMTIPVLAVLLAGASRPPAAQASAQEIITINPVLCLTLSSQFWGDAQTALTACQRLSDSAAGYVDQVVQVLRADKDADGNPKPVGKLEPEDFATIDMDGGQLHDEDGVLFIIGFVSNDDPVSFYADKGVFRESNSDPLLRRSDAFCGPVGPPSFDFTDEDCDDDGIRGDGVVVAALEASGAKRGDYEVRVRQNNIERSEPYTIVGEAHKITITPAKTVIQTGHPRCDMFADTPSFLNALQSPETTPFTTKIEDSDGTAISGAMAEFTISNPDGATVALPLAPSLDLSATLGSVVAPNVLCGLEEAGEITVTGEIVTGPEGVVLDSNAESHDVKVKFTVRSAPTDMVLSASPPNLTCDGVNSSTISATLTDSGGEKVIDGNRVHWLVKALGVVNPLDSKTAAGVATTVLTPLDGVTGGVVVRAWVELPISFGRPTPTPTPSTALFIPTPELPPIEFERVIERTILVACEGTAAEQPGAQPAGGQQPAISPPSTGSGGSSANDWLLALPVAAAALLLTGAGLILRRRAA